MNILLKLLYGLISILKTYSKLISSYRPNMFGGYRHCGSVDIMVLVCQVISQNHVTKGSKILCIEAAQGKLPF